MRIFSTVQKLSGLGYSSKGKKMAVCFRDNIIEKSLCLTVKEKICKDRKHTGHATMVVKVCWGSEEDPSLPSNAPHSWEGEEQ